MIHALRSLRTKNKYCAGRIDQWEILYDFRPPHALLWNKKRNITAIASFTPGYFYVHPIGLAGLRKTSKNGAYWSWTDNSKKKEKFSYSCPLLPWSLPMFVKLKTRFPTERGKGWVMRERIGFVIGPNISFSLEKGMLHYIKLCWKICQSRRDF